MKPTVQPDVLTYMDAHGRARPVEIHRAYPQYNVQLIAATLSALAKTGKIKRIERGVYELPGYVRDDTALIHGDLSLIQLLSNAVEHAPFELLPELLRDLRIAQTVRDRSSFWYAGIAVLVKRLEGMIEEVQTQTASDCSH